MESPLILTVHANPTRIWTCFGVLVAVLAISAAPGADETKEPKGVFRLKVGQSVSLKDEGSAFSITFFEPDLPQSPQGRRGRRRLRRRAGTSPRSPRRPSRFIRSKPS